MKLVPATQPDSHDRPVMRLPSVEVGVRKPGMRVLDFDIETVAAGFADPEWVPQKITCVAWSWMDEEEIHHRVCGEAGYFRQRPRKRMLIPLVEAIREADMVVGHNVLRFDLPVINSELMRFGLTPLSDILVHDTIRVARAKGFKKGQDVIARVLKIQNEKLPLDWQAWDDAYSEDKWPTVIERCVSDVRMHKEMYVEMKKREGLLREPITWKG